MKYFSLLMLSFLFSTGIFAQSAKEEVVATVGNKKITLEDFNKKYSDVKSQAINPPTKAQFLEELVRYEVGVQEAEKKNLQKDPIVQERMRQELYKALLEKEIGEKVQKAPITDKDMEEYYKKNPQIRISHILIETKPGATAEQRTEAKKRATEIYEEVKKSKRPFEELVHLYSDDTISKQAGGDAGWQGRQTIVPNMYETVLAMKVGEVRGLIETPLGFHIVKVTGRRSYENADRRVVRTGAFDEKRVQIFNEYFDKLKKNYNIKTNPSLIK